MNKQKLVLIFSSVMILAACGSDNHHGYNYNSSTSNTTNTSAATLSSVYNGTWSLPCTNNTLTNVSINGSLATSEERLYSTSNCSGNPIRVVNTTMNLINRGAYNSSSAFNGSLVDVEYTSILINGSSQNSSQFNNLIAAGLTPFPSYTIFGTTQGGQVVFGNAATGSGLTTTTRPTGLNFNSNAIATRISNSYTSYASSTTSVSTTTTTGGSTTTTTGGTTTGGGSTTTTTGGTTTTGASTTTTTGGSTTVNDLTPPAISFSAGSAVTLIVGQNFSSSASAVDAVDGPVSVSYVSGGVNTQVPGVYNLVYSAQDSSGNSTTATQTVTVVSDIKKH